MAVLISLSVITFLFGIFIFARGQHSMHQLQALIFFLFSALFLAMALLFKNLGEFFRRRHAAAAPAPPESVDVVETSAAEARPEA